MGAGLRRCDEKSRSGSVLSDPLGPRPRAVTPHHRHGRVCSGIVRHPPSSPSRRRPGPISAMGTGPRRCDEKSRSGSVPSDSLGPRPRAVTPRHRHGRVCSGIVRHPPSSPSRRRPGPISAMGTGPRRCDEKSRSGSVPSDSLSPHPRAVTPRHRHGRVCSGIVRHPPSSPSRRRPGPISAMGTGLRRRDEKSRSGSVLSDPLSPHPRAVTPRHRHGRVCSGIVHHPNEPEHSQPGQPAGTSRR